MVPPFDSAYAALPAMAAFGFVLAIGAGGVVAAAMRRRWQAVLLLLGFGVFSLTTRRSIAPAVLVIAPVSLAALAELLRGKVVIGRAWRAGRYALSALLLAAAAVLAGSVVSNRFYTVARQPGRFGLGLSRLRLPEDASRFLRETHPVGRLWTDWNSSSHLAFFAGRNVPLLTNGWAFPPAVLDESFTAVARPQRFRDIAERDDIQIVCLSAASSGPLMVALARDVDWMPVSISGSHVLFLRSRGPNAALARAHGLSPMTFSVEDYIASLRTSDPVPAAALLCGGKTLQLLTWDTHAIAVFRAAVDVEASAAGWFELGHAYAVRSRRRLDHDEARADLQEAIEALRRCMALQGEYRDARSYLDALRKDIERRR
jgi:hypothetical protein